MPVLFKHLTTFRRAFGCWCLESPRYTVPKARRLSHPFKGYVTSKYGTKGNFESPGLQFLNPLKYPKAALFAMYIYINTQMDPCSMVYLPTFTCFSMVNVGEYTWIRHWIWPTIDGFLLDGRSRYSWTPSVASMSSKVLMSLGAYQSGHCCFWFPPKGGIGDLYIPPIGTI